MNGVLIVAAVVVALVLVAHFARGVPVAVGNGYTFGSLGLASLAGN